MKLTLQQHERNAANHAANLSRKREELARLQADVQKMADDLAYYHKQITRARAEGKTAFDADKYKGE